jgi:hypothetical protein
MTAYPAALSL